MSDRLEARVDALFIYPVKACGAMPIPQLDIGPTGLIAGDREWAVVDERREVTWQGSHPRLALVRPTLAGDLLRLAAAPGANAGEAVEVSAAAGAPCIVQMWNDSLQQTEHFGALDAGDTVAAWLRQLVGVPLRLVRFGPEALARRGLNPLHLVSTASLDELNQHLAADGQAPADGLRFRPNLVLGAAEEPLLPFIEEQVSELWGGDPAGGWRMPVAAPCVRCIVPGVDPQTAEVNQALPPAVAELSAQRTPGGPSCFGVYATPAAGARIRVGDRVGLALNF